MNSVRRRSTPSLFLLSISLSLQLNLSQADAITDHVFRDLIPSASSAELLSLLSFLSQRVYGRAPPALAAAGVTAETAALRAFVVSAIKSGNPKAALELLSSKADELCGTDASSAADWAPWFALPHLSSNASSSSSAAAANSSVFPKCFRALNDPSWAQEAEATFRNALAEAACSLPPPALLRLGRAGNRSEKEVAARAAALEAENAKLRARVEALERRAGGVGGEAAGAGAGTASAAAAAAAAVKSTSDGAGRGGGRATTATAPPPPRPSASPAAVAASGPPAASPPLWSWSPASPGLAK